MFRKLVSDLSFSPSLVSQLGFYSRRLKKEKFIRKLGLLFAVLVVLLQSLVLLAPAKATLAASANDIVWGGGDKQELLQAYHAGCDHYIEPRCDIKAIFNSYGINEANLGVARQESIYSSNTNNYWLIGRTHHSAADTAAYTADGSSLRTQALHRWKNGLNKWWEALRIETKQGTRWLLTGSGNIVSKGKPAATPVGEQHVDQLELHKKVRNITQQLDDANGTIARAGDGIEYTLSVTNRGPETRRSFVIKEELEDVLEYADIIGASGAAFSQSPTRHLTWPAVDIQPNETITRTILTQIKSPIPASPASISDPKSYDMKLLNTYGDTVQINLPPSVLKMVEQSVQLLPNTNITSNIILSGLFFLLVSYFYLRNRLIIKELSLIRQQFNSGAPL